MFKPKPSIGLGFNQVDTGKIQFAGFWAKARPFFLLNDLQALKKSVCPKTKQGSIK